MNERVRRYNEAARRVQAAVTALRNAPSDADLSTLEAEFRTAEAEAKAALQDLERADELDNVERTFQPRVVETPPAELGMDQRQVREYSLARAILAAGSQDWRGAELEREASDEIAKRMGREASGFFVPLDVQHQKRDLVVGTEGAGGYLVADELRPQSFIEMKRNRMLLRKAGATVLSGLVGDVAIPRQTGGASFYWVAESGAPTESQQTVDQVAITPHAGGAFTDMSRKLLKQSSIDVENFVRRDLATVCALGIDLAGFHGTGENNQPTGLAATTGIGSVPGGTDGLAPAWSHLVKLETEVAVDNADEGALAYITNPKVRGKLKTTPRVASTDSEMIWDVRAGATPVNGYAAHISNQVSSTLVKGSSGSVCSAIFFGNWADMIIGEWGVLDILVDPFTGGTAGTLRVIALQDVDIAVRQPGSFAAMLDALTA